MSKVKQLIKRVPVLRAVARFVSRQVARLGRERFGSAEYWERRYASGRSSGPGSYNRLALFKAEILNEFVQKMKIATVLELGSGDGAQLELAEYPSYVGVDVSPTIVEQANEKFRGDTTKSFVLLDYISETRADLTLSLDVIYHLVEDTVFEAHMRELFDRANRFTIVYSSKKNEMADSVHVRHRLFTEWVRINRSDFELTSSIPNRFPFDRADPDNTSFADFYIFKRL